MDKYLLQVPFEAYDFYKFSVCFTLIDKVAHGDCLDLSYSFIDRYIKYSKSIDLITSQNSFKYLNVEMLHIFYVYKLITLGNAASLVLQKRRVQKRSI